MTQYVIANDDYLQSGYVDATYVGTDSDLYVEAGYVTGVITASATLASTASLTGSISTERTGTASLSSAVGVSTQGTKTAQADLSVTAQFTQTTQASKTANPTVAISGALSFAVQGVAQLEGDVALASAFGIEIATVKFRTASAELIHAGDDPVWDTGLTWAEPRSEIWGPLVTADATRVRRGVATLSGSFGFDAQPNLIRAESSLAASFGTVSIDGQRTRNTSATTTSNFAVASAGQTNIAGGVATLSSVFTQSEPTPIVVFSGTSTILASFAVGAAPARILRSTNTNSSEYALSADAVRTRNTSASVSSAFALSADADLTRDGTVLSVSAGTLAIDGVRTRNTSASFASEFAVPDPRLGGLLSGSATFSALTATLGALTVYRIDPFRIFRVKSEDRALEIVAESRIFTTKSENRLNTIEQETRAYPVPSEIRTLVTQPLTLVNVAGTAIDRREG